MILRPCGACGELVPADTGCEHWRPGRSAKAADSATRRLAARGGRKIRTLDMSPKAVAGREQRRKDRQDAAARVAEFHRMMGRTYS